MYKKKNRPEKAIKNFFNKKLITNGHQLTNQKLIIKSPYSIIKKKEKKMYTIKKKRTSMRIYKKNLLIKKNESLIIQAVIFLISKKS